MAYRDLQVPTHNGPLHELLGFDVTPLVSGGIEGLSTFSVTSAESTDAMTELAVRAALLGDGTSKLPSGQFDQLGIQLATSREFTDSLTSDALERAIGSQMNDWNVAVATSLQHANAALLEALVFDVLGGFPSDAEIAKLKPETTDENLYADSWRKERVLQRRTGVGGIALRGGEASEYLEAKAIFREATAEDRATMSDAPGLYYNRMIGDKWHLDHLVIWHRKALGRVGLRETDETIDATRVIFKTHDFFAPRDDGLPTLMAVNIQKGNERFGTASYYNHTDLSQRRTRDNIGSVRLALNELRGLIAPGQATQVMATNTMPIHHEGPPEPDALSGRSFAYRLRLRLSEALRPKDA